jgi:hypothetical protein
MTILEVLENADYNLQNAEIDMQIQMAKEQLHNALILISKGLGLEDEFDEEKLTSKDVSN